MIVKDKAIKCVAKTALFNEAGQVLVLTRSNTDAHRPGGLDFPGGKVDAGEDVLAGACREILEEIGVALTPSALQIIYTNAEDKDGKVVLRFLCVAQIEEPMIKLSPEHSAYEWTGLEEVISRFDTVSWAQGLRFGLKNNIFTNQ